MHVPSGYEKTNECIDARWAVESAVWLLAGCHAASASFAAAAATAHLHARPA
jgi:hypothetical protein